ncbi:MAG: rRNA maturation RNase YbeY [Candidatus Spyradosoma sp.]
MNDEIAIACRGFRISRREVKTVLKRLRERAPWEFPAGALSVAFADDARTCDLHARFLNDPSKTDVITFPGDEIFTAPRRRDVPAETARSRGADADAFAGEIVVCVPQAQRAAAQFGTTPADELLLYLVHGWLHLAGLDDIVESDRARMRAAEAEALEILRAAGAAPFSRVAFPKISESSTEKSST